MDQSTETEDSSITEISIKVSKRAVKFYFLFFFFKILLRFLTVQVPFQVLGSKVKVVRVKKRQISVVFSENYLLETMYKYDLDL